MSGWTHLAYWEHTPHPFLLRLGENFGIRYYGLAYLLGFLGAAWIMYRYHRTGRTPLNGNAIMDLMLAIVAGVIVGGRLGYFVLYQPAEVLRDPLVLLRVWEGGMASHGGFLGVVVALAWFARKHRVSFLHLGDLVTTTAPLGLLLGRLANFANGELWGKVSAVRWAMIFDQSGGGRYPRHPSQLYEAALEGVLLLTYLQLRFWKSETARRTPGWLAGEFLLGYAAARLISEVYREPDAALILGMSRGSFYSIFLIAGGLAVMIWSRRAAARSQREA
jgi:phosphatidylglycerol:prolipoprotein diacylglycerol transferase